MAGQPDTQLMSKLELQGDKSAISRCPAIRGLLTERHIPFGDEAMKTAMGDKRAEYSASLESVSLPALSHDGQSALIATSWVKGATEGEGYIELMRRQPSGEWIVVSRAVTWVS